MIVGQIVFRKNSPVPMIVLMVSDNYVGTIAGNDRYVIPKSEILVR